MEASDTFGPTRIVPPAYGARVRAALPPEVRAKFDLLEADASNKLAVVRAVGDRLAEVRATLVATEQRIAMLQAAGSHRYVNLEDEQAALTDEQQRVATLTAERDAATARWQAASQLLDSCRTYLDLA